MYYLEINGLSIRETVLTIMASKPLDVIAGQPITQTTHLMTEQLAKMTAAVRTTAWRGQHGILALVLFEENYRVSTRNLGASTLIFTKPEKVSQGLSATSTPYQILTA